MAGQKNVSFTISAEDKASAELKNVQNALTDMSGSWFDFGKVMQGIPGILAGISFTVIIKDLIDMGTATDATMRQIGAVLPTGIEGLDALREQIDAVAESSGRSIEDVRAAAAEIAKLGVSGGSDLTERLRVAVEFADATGSNLQTTAAGVTTIMRTFNLTAGQVEQVMANMASAAKGKVDVEELFNIFGRAAPKLQELGVDATTATEAMVALINRGFNARKAGAFITQLDLDGIKQLAAEAPAATSALKDMKDQAQLVEGGAGRAGAAVKDKLKASLDDLATKTLPLVLGGLQALNGLIDVITKKANKQSLAEFGKAILPDFFTAMFQSGSAGASATPAATTFAFGGGGGFDGVGSSGTFGTRKGLPLTDAQKKAIDSLRASMAAYSTSLDDAGNKSASAAAKVADLTAKIEASKMSDAEKTASIKTLNAALGVEQWKEFGDAMKSSLQLTGDALDSLKQKWDDEIARLEQDKKVATDPALVVAIQARILALKQAEPAAIAFADALAKSKDTLAALSQDIKDNGGSYAALAVDIGKAQDEVTQWELAVDRTTPGTKENTEAIAEKTKAYSVLQSAISAQQKDFLSRLDAMAAAQIKQLQNLQDTARGYADLAKSVLSAAQQLGGFGASATSALIGVADLANGVSGLAKAMNPLESPEGFAAGGGFGAITAMATSLASIGASIQQTSAENAAAAAQFKTATAQWQESFQSLISGLTNTDFQKAQQSLNQQFESIVNQAVDAAATAIKGSPAATWGSTGVGIFGSTTGTVPSEIASIADLGNYIKQLTAEQGSGKNVAQDRDLATLLTELQQVDAQYRAQAQSLQALQAVQLQQAEADLNVRNLAAEGQTAASQLAAKLAADAKELQAAITSYGADSQYVTDLKATQALEEAQASASSTGAASSTTSVGSLSAMSYAQGDTANSLLLTIKNAMVNVDANISRMVASWGLASGASSAGASGPMTVGQIGPIGPIYVDGGLASSDVVAGVQIGVGAAIDQALGKMRMNLRAAAGAPKGG